MAGQGISQGRVPGRGPSRSGALLDKAIAGCADDEVEEVRSLGNTLARWRAEILAHHDIGASNRPTRKAEPVREEGQARCSHGFRTFEHYSLRVLSTLAVSPGRVVLARRASEPASPLKRVGPPTGCWR